MSAQILVFPARPTLRHAHGRRVTSACEFLRKVRALGGQLSSVSDAHIQLLYVMAHAQMLEDEARAS